MATVLSNPTNDQMVIRLVGPNGERDGMHLQPHAKQIPLPEGHRVHPNTLHKYPRLVVGSSAA